MADDEKKPAYDVGYGKTPQHTRFKPGQSGNPKGKPKGAKNLATIVGNAIKEKVVVTDKNGKRKSVSKLEVAVTQLANKAASGDQKALLQLIPLVQLIEGRAEAAAISVPVLAEADHLVMANIGERFKKSLLQNAAKPQQEAEVIPVDKEKDDGQPDAV